MSDSTSQYIIAQEEHNYNKKYEKGTTVEYTIDGVTTAYTAKKNVPKFISILNENYWKKIASTNEDGTKKYSDLEEKPSINGVELDGNKTSQDLGVYSKPSSGIPQSDLAQSVQISLNKADTAYQKSNTGIPKSDLSSDVQQALQKHFKGWYNTLAELKAAHTAIDGDSAYVKDASPATTWSIYVYDSTTSSDNYWADSGTDADTSNVQTFASSQEVNEVHIIKDLTTGGEDDIASAETVKDLVEGFSISSFDYSQFAPVSDGGSGYSNNIVLASDNRISFEQVGDFVELDVNPNNAIGNDLIIGRQTPYGSSIGVYYVSENVLYIRTTVSAYATYQFTSGVMWNVRQKIKIVLTNKEDNQYTYDVYVNDTKIISSQTFTVSNGFYFEYIGRRTNMKLYSIKGKRGGVDYEFKNFAEFSDAVGITDAIISENYNGVIKLNEDVDKLNGMVGSDMYYEYYTNISVTNTTYYNCTKFFRIYQRIKENVYLRFGVGYYVGQILEDPHNYWRIVGCNLVTITDGTVTVITDSDMSDSRFSVLTSGENEFVLKWTAGDGYNFSNYSGGYHFGETIDDDNCFVEFLADGNIIDLTNNIPLTPCKTFMYRELSNIYQNNDSPASIAANHFKETRFANGGYTTENNIVFLQALGYYAYNGIVCVDRWISQKAMPENVATITDMGSGSPTQASQFSSHNHKIHYEGHGYGCDVESHINFGADDSECTLVVYNDTAYNKYYRRNPDTEGNVNNRIGGITSVKIYCL